MTALTEQDLWKEYSEAREELLTKYRERIDKEINHESRPFIIEMYTKFLTKYSARNVRDWSRQYILSKSAFSGDIIETGPKTKKTILAARNYMAFREGGKARMLMNKLAHIEKVYHDSFK